MTITITGLNQALVDRGAADRSGNDGIADRFLIKMTNVGANEELPITQAEAAADSRLAKFYLQENQPYVLDPPDVTSATGQHSMRYYIDVIEATSGALKSAATSGSVTMYVAFYLGIVANKDFVVEKKDISVIQEIYLINAQPAFAGDSPIAGSHEMLIVNWQVETSVATLGGGVGNKEPSGVVVYVIHPDVPSQNLPAKVFSGVANTADADGTCSYTKPPVGQGSACIVCGEKTYLNRTAIKDISGIFVVTGKNSDGQATIKDLDNDVPAPYTVFMQYTPDGLGASTCLPGQPSPNFTLTELNGEGEAQVVDFRCFVATAAYGTPLAEDLKYFRKFRSNVLLKSTAGRTFVHYYYKYSPPLAHFIAEHPRLQAMVRGILEVPAHFLKSVDEYY